MSSTAEFLFKHSEKVFNMATLIQLKEDMAGIKLPINKAQLHIGRGHENDVSIDDELVSNQHAVIEAVEGLEDNSSVDYYIKDLESTNGTYVNDKRITLYKLSNEDTIRIGMNNFKFVNNPDEEMDDTTKLHNTWIPGIFYTKSKKKKRKKKS